MSRAAKLVLLSLPFLLLLVPPFICQELHFDVGLFDAYARNLQRGGVAYRDWCEVNLPGMAWLHWGIRSLVGWRSESMRAVDLGVFGAVLLLLLRWFRAVALEQRLLLGVTLLIFYLTVSEWCHAQRDVWMLLPALGALYLRRAQVVRPIFLRTVAEGLLWAAAFWIKPHVLVPGLLAWLVAARLARREGNVSLGQIMFDGVGVLAGGAIVGALGVIWLKQTGAWPFFIDMQTVWSREYLAYDATVGQRWTLVLGFLVRFFPWILIHLAAVPIALRSVIRGAEKSGTLLAALYLGWLLQALFLQHLFDYVHLPALLLAFAVVLGRAGAVSKYSLTFLAGQFACVAFTLLIWCPPRLAALPQCWREGSSPAVRDRVSILHKVDWQDLARVAEYLRGRELQNGELTCFHMSTSPLLRELDVEPATRYHFFQNNWLAFPGQRERIHADLAASRQRFVVCDLRWAGIDLAEPDLDLFPPRWDRWKKRVVFQSGRYIVLEMTGAEGPAWLTECFDDLSHVQLRR